MIVWANERGCKISTDETKYVMSGFKRKNSGHMLSLYGTCIERVEAFEL